LNYDKPYSAPSAGRITCLACLALYLAKLRRG
jgi:hypothetical protein